MADATNDVVPEQDEADPPFVIPGVRPWLISCDESGMDGARFLGFGSLWMDWDRRGDFVRDIREICSDSNMKTGMVDGVSHEFKWSKVKQKKLPFYKRLVEYFFRQPRIWFHCIVVRKADVRREFHPGGPDEYKQKFLTMLLTNKIKRAVRHRPRKFRVWVDPLPVAYRKAHEVVEIISNHVLNAEFGDISPVDKVIPYHSHEKPSIQLCDLLLGAVMSAWQEDATAPGKVELQRFIAEHLRWNDLAADTRVAERKFNIWFFYDKRKPRDVVTRDVILKYPHRFERSR